MHLEPGDVLVARVWRWDVERLQVDAAVALRESKALGDDPPRASVSTFAMAPNQGETTEDLMQRLCAHIAGIPRSSKYVTFTTLRRLEQAGFEVRSSPPPPHHHDVFVNLSDNQEFQVLFEVFEEEPRRRFPTCETV